MLQILLIVLKCIGWFLLAILGIVLFGVFVFLCVPLRYHLEVDAKQPWKQTDVQLRFSWLGRLVQGRATYENSLLNWKVRIAWIHLQSEDEVSLTTEDSSPALKIKSKKSEEKVVASLNLEEKEKETPKSESEALPNHQILPKEDTKEFFEEATVDPSSNVVQEESKAFKKQQREKGNPKERTSRQQNGEKPSIWERIQAILQKIKYTYEKICANIKEVQRKKGVLKEFLLDETHMRAFVSLLQEAKGLFRRLRPDQIKINLAFGFEDPALTGYALAAFSVLKAYFAEEIQLDPNFTKQVFEGEIMVHGRMHLRHLIRFARRLLCNRHIRVTIRHVRNFSFSA
jgi:hypothetical protein